MCGVPPLKKLKRRRRPMVTHKRQFAIQRILSNSVYAGLIRVPAHKYKAQKNIKGMHEAIISESYYWTAQNILNGHERIGISSNEDVHSKKYCVVIAAT
jgi:site-specific DNA recombinase